jgi:branched-chain amino acid aminotransferase
MRAVMSRKIWLDGSIVDESEAKISVFDHGILYGDGIFEGIRFYEGRVFRLTEHIERLFLSAKAILLKLPWTVEEVCEYTLDTIRANGLKDGYIRLVITRGVGDLGLNPYLCEVPSMFIIASGITLYPDELYENGLEVVTCSTRRPTPASLSPQVKSLNYLNNVMAKVEALKAGAKEGLMKKGEVITPPVSDGSLDGITRQVIFDLCGELGISIREASLTRYDIYTADESFLTGTAAETIPMVMLDEREIGNGRPGELSLKLIDAFRKLVRSEGTAF